jgi:hypothetical protein
MKTFTAFCLSVLCVGACLQAAVFRAIDAEFTSDKLKYKMDVNLGYEISKNFILTASFGKEFGTKTLPISKSGNLFALLNLIGGLGERKP